MMKSKTVHIDGKPVSLYQNASISQLQSLVSETECIIITDSNVFQYYKTTIASYRTIVIEPGESNKIWNTIEYIINKLIDFKADRNTTLIGMGGGVVTDITGFLASIYMRGLRYGFIPTSLLNMVDASIGGKNGIDFGPYKNMLGTIEQPAFIFYDIQLLKTLPDIEWSNGFAEIIKHACIQSPELFDKLSQHSLSFYQNNLNELEDLIDKNVKIKLEVVIEDPKEKGIRKYLNFGHTLGHVIETQKKIPHGQAISIGMMMMAKYGNKHFAFDKLIDLENLLKNYNLPTDIDWEIDEIIDTIQLDKKKQKSVIHFILLKKIGQPFLHPIEINSLRDFLKDIHE